MSSNSPIPIKLCVAGPSFAGKSTLIYKYIFGSYLSTFKSTAVNDFSKKNVTLPSNKEASLQIWDIAGEEKYASLTKIFTKGAQGKSVVIQGFYW